ncbi:MAG TPA: L,D-transpeptidase [Patescibacteria group bacterium]|nr:L,D-transpeptidase [Patescibacteria group bacterium]
MPHAKKIFLVLALVLVFAGIHASDTIAKEETQKHFSNNEEVAINLDLPFEEIGQVIRVDLGNDGTEEIIVSAGFDESPTVAVLREDGSRIGDFLAFMPEYKRGVTVTAGNVDEDPTIEIITSTMSGGGPHVRVYDAYGELENQFFAYNQAFKGGVNLTTADIDGDGIDEIITAAGLEGGPHVRAVRPDGRLIAEFFAFDATDRAGVSVTHIDENGDGRDELVVSHFGHGAPEARIVRFDFKNNAALSIPFKLYDDYEYGTSLFSVDDKTFGAAPNGNNGPHVRMFNTDGIPVSNRMVFDDDHARVHAAATSPDDLIVATARPVLSSRLDKHIFVNLDEQRLYALDDGVIQKTYLISSGKWPFRTPTGDFEVMRKLRWHDYVWSYGKDDVRNYNLPNVEYNLEFTRHFYIHHAYWHNNWGNPMSHGCVNAPYEGVEWTFNWAEVGTPVVVS